MEIRFQLFFLIFTLKSVTSDSHFNNFHQHQPDKNIFFDNDKPQTEHCQTSLGDHGVCVPLLDCPHLLRRVEGSQKDRVVAVVAEFGCGYRQELLVCCTERQNHDHHRPTELQLFPLQQSEHPSPQHPQQHDYQGFQVPQFLSSGGITHTNFGDSNIRPGQSGFSSESLSQNFGSNHGTQGSYSSNSFGSQGIFGNERPQSFGNSHSNTQGFGSIHQGLSNNERPLISSGESHSNNLFVGGSGANRRPGNQGYNNNNQGLLNVGRPQSSGNSRPVNEGFGSSGQGIFQNERPVRGNGRPSTDQTTFGGSSFSGSSGIDQGFGNNRPTNVDSFGSSRPSQNFGNSQLNQGFGSSHNEGNSFSFGENTDFSNGYQESSKPNRDNQRPSSNHQKRPSSGSSSSFNNTPGGGNRKPSGKPNSRKPNRSLLPDGNCGVEIADKIIGGENTGLDEYPWMALLHFGTNNGEDRGFGCGGSLINNRYVLTAAHCIKGSSLPSNVVIDFVRLGEYDVTKARDCLNGVCSPEPIDAGVEEVIVHPEYNPRQRGQYNDIALIRLKNRVSFNTFVSPICLPGENQAKKDYSGKQMVVAGWGKTSNGVKSKASTIKQKVSLPFVRLTDCKPFYEGINITLKTTQMCAGGENAKDSCQGDSGGPLMYHDTVNGHGSWVATGIVSFGPEDCGIKNIAGVYTKVADYIPWILENLRE